MFMQHTAESSRQQRSAVASPHRCKFCAVSSRCLNGRDTEAAQDEDCTADMRPFIGRRALPRTWVACHRDRPVSRHRFRMSHRSSPLCIACCLEVAPATSTQMGRSGVNRLAEYQTSLYIQAAFGRPRKHNDSRHPRSPEASCPSTPR